MTIVTNCLLLLLFQVGVYMICFECLYPQKLEIDALMKNAMVFLIASITLTQQINNKSIG